MGMMYWTVARDRITFRVTLAMTLFLPRPASPAKSATLRPQIPCLAAQEMIWLTAAALTAFLAVMAMTH